MSEVLEEMFELIDLYFQSVKKGALENCRKIDQLFNEKMRANYDHLETTDYIEVAV